MSYSHNSHGTHGKGQYCGITAPYCPPPACPPMEPMPCMDHCPQPESCCSSQKAHKVPLHKAMPWPKPVKPCPPSYQNGAVCPLPPMKPSKPKCESVLLQKIVCCEKRHIPQLCTRLELEGLCACPPYRLLSVQPSGAQPWWSPLESHGPDARHHIKVFIPVCCQVCDGEGHPHTATTVVEAEVSYRPCCPPSDCSHANLFIVPWVRLTGGDVCSEEAVFCVQLEVSLEIYLLRPQPCAMHRPEPACPELPLYPIPPHWQRNDW